MLYIFYVLLCLFGSFVQGILWKNGIIHYAINNKDYDAHSQEIIISTLSKLQDEICIKFFQTAPDFNSTENDKILYINNPDKRKTCSPNLYDFTKTVVDMPIGYKCLNQKEIARILIEMLRASIDSNGNAVNSYDLVNKFEEKDPDIIKSSLISSWERNFINTHYKSECGVIMPPLLHAVRRRTDKQSSDSLQLSEANLKYYNDKLWPMGIVLYGVDEKLVNTADFKALKQSMTTIELSTCVVFQEVVLDGVLLPKSLIWFAETGEDMPRFGFVEGQQTVKLSSMVNGAPGHTAHTVNNLLRILGVHMMSNRFDRDNHVIINWNNVEMGKEQYLEKAPEESWMAQIPYDFDSVTHAPANYMCSKCDLGATTVQPIQDKLWQRTLSMGHTTDLSESDKKFVNILYSDQCSKTLRK